MSFYRVQVRVPTDSGLPADVATNTFHFASDDDDTEALELADILTALTTLYQAIDSQLSENVGTTAIVKAYDLEEALPRAPLMEEAIALTPGASQMPNQVAVCCNLHAALVSGQPRGRLRGRVFFGPLADIGVDSSQGDLILPAAARDVFGNALGAMIPTVATPISTSTITLHVFSHSDALDLPVGASPSVPGSGWLPEPQGGYSSAQLSDGFHPVTSVRITDRFSVVRSRRTTPSAPSIYT